MSVLSEGKDTTPATEWMVIGAKEATLEEQALLAITDRTAFETAALEFVQRRKHSNAGIVSLDARFLTALAGRCVELSSSSSSSSTEVSKTYVCSELLQALLANGVDVSIHQDVLPALLQVNDLDTIVLFLLRVQTIKVPDLLHVLGHLLKIDPTVVQAFAMRNGWETRSAVEQKRVLLSVVGRIAVRVRCDLTALRTGLAALTVDEVYGLTVLLTMMLLELDQEKEEEKQLYAKNGCPPGRLYANALIQWMNSMLDANLMRMVVESKSDERFVQ